jgi:DNA-binding transcriptional MerR regulator
MTRRYLRTSDLAKAVGVHVNTVRLYEEWGFLPSIPRSPTGYRLFTQAHLEQMRLARLAMHGPWPGGNIRKSALALVRKAASGDLGGALEQAYHHLALVQTERARAEAAAEIGRLRVVRMLLRAGYSMMAILRMLLQLDRGADPRQALDTPHPDEDTYTAADQWLSSLAEQEQRASSIITQIEKMIGA